MHIVKLHGQNAIAGHPDGAVFDLSSYLRIARDEGMDADDGDFLQPQFGESPLADGQPLLNVTSSAREKVYPLALRESSPAEVQQLQRDLVWHTQHNGPLRLEERADGATDSAWWDVQFARFEPETNVRRAQHGWKLGTLRVWCEPYAHTATSRLVATAAATNTFLVVTPPIGGLAGDTDGALDVTVTFPKPPKYVDYIHSDGQVAFAAVLPHASYRIYHPANTFALAPNVILHADSTAPGGGEALASPFWPPPTIDRHLFTLELSPASVYRGRHRVLALTNSDSPNGIALRAFGRDRSALGPTAIATTTKRSLVDLGTFDIDDAYRATSVPIRVHAGHMPLDAGIGWPGGASFAGQPAVAALLVLPDDASVFAIDTGRRPIAADTITPAASGPMTGSLDAYGNQWATTALAPAGPLWLFPATRGDLGLFGAAGNYHPSLAGYQTLGNQLRYDDRSRDLSVEAVFTVRAVASCALSLIKSIASNTYARADLQKFGAGATAARIGVSVVDNGSVVASQAFSFGTTELASPTLPLVLSLQTAGQQISAAIDGSEDSAVVTATAACVDAPGQAVVLCSATVNASAPDILIGGLRVTSLPSTPADAGMGYQFNAVDGRIVRLAPATSGVPGPWQDDISARQRGAIPAAPVPTIPGVAVGALPLDGGDTNNNPRVEVRVRERFTFVR